MSPHRVAAVAAALLVLAVGGCSVETPDYQSVWSKSSSAPPPSETPTEAPVPIAQYLEGVGVTGRTVTPEELPGLTASIPTPPGWQPYRGTQFEAGTRVIAKGDTYPIAMLVVFELSGQFDPVKAIEHGDDDARLSDNFKELNASQENWRGLPSAMIEGTYDLNGQRMQTYNRVVIATGAPPANQRYLVQLTVTSFADEAQKYGKDIETILAGFTVAPKT